MPSILEMGREIKLCFLERFKDALKDEASINEAVKARETIKKSQNTVSKVVMSLAECKDDSCFDTEGNIFGAAEQKGYYFDRRGLEERASLFSYDFKGRYRGEFSTDNNKNSLVGMNDWSFLILDAAICKAGLDVFNQYNSVFIADMESSTNNAAERKIFFKHADVFALEPIIKELIRLTKAPGSFDIANSALEAIENQIKLLKAPSNKFSNAEFLWRMDARLRVLFEDILGTYIESEARSSWLKNAKSLRKTLFQYFIDRRNGEITPSEFQQKVRLLLDEGKDDITHGVREDWRVLSEKHHLWRGVLAKFELFLEEMRTSHISTKVFVAQENKSLPAAFRSTRHGKNYRVGCAMGGDSTATPGETEESATVSAVASSSRADGAEEISAGDSISAIYKTCKNKNKDYTVFESLFSTVWKTAIPELTPSITRLTYGKPPKPPEADSSKAEKAGVFVSESIDEIEVDKITGICIQRLPGFISLYDLKKSHEQLIAKFSKEDLPEDVKALKVIFEGFTMREWDNLNVIERIFLISKHFGKPEEAIYQQLAKILVTAYAIQEDDLHLGNIGISIVDNDVKVVKIDHDMSFFHDIAEQASKKPRPLDYLPWGSNRFEVRYEDLESFPDLQHADPIHWPTKHRVKLPTTKAYYFTREDNQAFSALKEKPAFKEAKTNQIQQFLEMNLDDLRKELYQSVGKQSAVINAVLRAIYGRKKSLAAALSRWDEVENPLTISAGNSLSAAPGGMVTPAVSKLLADKPILQRGSKSIAQYIREVDECWELPLKKAKELCLSEFEKEVNKTENPKKLAELYDFLQSDACSFIRQLQSKSSFVRAKRGSYGLSNHYIEMVKRLVDRAKTILEKEKGKLFWVERDLLKKIINSTQQSGWEFKKAFILPDNEKVGTVYPENTAQVLSVLDKVKVSTPNDFFGVIARLDDNQRNTGIYLERLDDAMRKAARIEQASSFNLINKFHKKQMKNKSDIAVTEERGSHGLIFSRRLTKEEGATQSTNKIGRYVLRQYANDSEWGLRARPKAKAENFSTVDKHYAIIQFALFVVFRREDLRDQYKAFSLASGKASGDAFELVGADKALVAWAKPVFNYVLKAYKSSTGLDKEIKVGAEKVLSAGKEMRFSTREFKVDGDLTASKEQQEMVNDLLSQMLAPPKLSSTNASGTSIKLIH